MNHFFVVVLGGEGAELVLEKRKTQRVFHHLHVSVVLQISFLNDAPNGFDHVVPIAHCAKYFLRLRSVKDLGFLAPTQVALSPFWKARTRPFEAQKVLTIGGKTQSFGSLGRDTLEPLGKAIRVQQLTRLTLLSTRIFRAQASELGDGEVEAIHVINLSSPCRNRSAKTRRPAGARWLLVAD